LVGHSCVTSRSAAALVIIREYAVSKSAILDHALQPLDFVRSRKHHGGHVSGWVGDLAGVAAQFVGVVGHCLVSVQLNTLFPT
jgi:hypothetical protein